MRHLGNVSRPLAAARLSSQSRLAGRRTVLPLSSALNKRSLFTGPRKVSRGSSWSATLIASGLVVWLLYPSDDFAQLASSADSKVPPPHANTTQEDGEDEAAQEEPSSWAVFAQRLESLSTLTDNGWFSFPDKLAGYVLPDWSQLIPGYLRKLQRELSMTPGSLAEEIWQEAQDPSINPEIRYTAEVRISGELCKEEQEYLVRRRQRVKAALAKYLDVDEKDINPDDIPTIALSGSGGGLRALVAGTGSLLATEEDGLFDCVTYTSGVSGSCWLQMLYLTSFNKGNISSLLEHLKARTGTHIAYPPVTFQSLTSLPTSKYLLSGLVERLRGDPHADFGLVDIYGMMLASRFLVPKGELGVNDKDFKLSNQREYMKNGQRPLPIYTAVRHEIPDIDTDKNDSKAEVEEAKEQAKKEAWFQWFEITPYEFFCEEFGAGIPTWALGRKFDNGTNVTPESGLHLPEIRLPLLMGIFGSAFCATLSHYYKEVQPLVRGISGLGAVDELISGHDEDMSKIHPIDPALVPNFAYGMQEKLPHVQPSSVCDDEYIQLMDAGMSNNLPIYPLLRPGRNVDVLISFDASADIKTDNWLSVADGYARQRGIKGWPVGIGWPKPGESVKETTDELKKAGAQSAEEADQRVKQAQEEQKALRKEANAEGESTKSASEEGKYEPGNQDAGDLGPCTVWVGTTQEQTPTSQPSKAITDSDAWRLSHPDAGITIIYLPFLANKKVPGVSPGESDYLSTWNFIYTPEQIDSVVKLARANYDEGKQQIKSTVRAVYERKKQLREEGEKRKRNEFHLKVAKQSAAALLGEADQFS